MAASKAAVAPVQKEQLKQIGIVIKAKACKV